MDKHPIAIAQPQDLLARWCTPAMIIATLAVAWLLAVYSLKLAFDAGWDELSFIAALGGFALPVAAWFAVALALDAARRPSRH